MFAKPVVHGIYMLCYLSRQDAGSVTSASTLAKAVDVPPEHARKILMRLCAAGLVISVKGRSGGYAPTRRLEETSVLDVVDAVNPLATDDHLQPRVCAAAPDRACLATQGFVELRDQMRKLLAGRTVASFIGNACSESAEAFVTTIGEE